MKILSLSVAFPFEPLRLYATSHLRGMTRCLPSVPGLFTFPRSINATLPSWSLRIRPRGKSIKEEACLLSSRSMRRFGVRAGLLAGTSLAVVAIAGVGASSASAACSGTIKGQGSSLQRIAQQENWIPSYTAESCTTGTHATPEYTSSSSGTGLAAWGATGSAITREWTYIGTDDGPSSTQITNMKTAAGGAATSSSSRSPRPRSPSWSTRRRNARSPNHQRPSRRSVQRQS